MTTPLSSDPLLTDTALGMLAEEIACQGYCILANGLDPVMCSTLLADAHRLDENGQLRKAGVGREGAEIASIRGDRILWIGPTLSLAIDGFLTWIEQLRLYLNRHLYLGLTEYEGHLACYEPGAGYTKHLDRLKGSDARALTLIVYLNPEWTDEDGGMLRLYLRDDSYLDIMPQSGTMVAFLSGDFPHEVLPSQRSRWAITGWFRQTPT